MGRCYVVYASSGVGAAVAIWAGATGVISWVVAAGAVVALVTLAWVAYDSYRPKP